MRGAAVGINDPSCLKAGAKCAKPTAQVNVQIAPTAGATTGLTATADAVATVGRPGTPWPLGTLQGMRASILLSSCLHARLLACHARALQRPC